MSNICQMCGNQPSTILYTQSINGITAKKHLCKSCADKMQIFGWESFFGFDDFLKSAGLFSGQTTRGTATQKCVCGTTREDILESCKFGCEKCFETFSDIVAEFGTKRHKGKRPINARENKVEKKSDSTLRATEKAETRQDALLRELRTAVAQENYERAEALKTAIKQLEGNE